jgi:lysophospholipid acyltransferase (LPLAT)-like uncharacterized protein
MRLVDANQTLDHLRTPPIACLWHNRLALSMWIWKHLRRYCAFSAGLVALISASHDGGILARVLRFFKVEAVRGSTSRRGAQALLELTSWTDRGYVIAITPDGPRGPRYRVHDGILALAQVSGRPIVPVSSKVGWKLCLKSWDRFQVPLPFARCEVRIGEPLIVPRHATDQERESLRHELTRRMMELTSDD